MPKVSILVAAYNAVTYLPKCLESLQGQTLGDIEIICVDDCSTDGTLSLMRRYAEADNRIKLFHLDKNHGQAFARNTGLQAAQGEYICFLDADDWYSPDALQRAVQVFEQHTSTDCVLFEVELVHHDHTETYIMPQFDVLSGNEAFNLSLDWQIHGVYMVRRSLHIKYPYDDTCKSFSDDNTTRMHFMASRQVRRCKGVYHYLQLPSSTTHQVSVRRFDFLRANESMKRQLKHIGASDDVMRKWETTRMLVLVDCYMFHHCHGHQLTAEERAYGLSEMKRIWHNIDRSLLTEKATHKFGYRPMPAWWLFRLQEWAYFTVRGWLGKNK